MLTHAMRFSRPRAGALEAALSSGGWPNRQQATPANTDFANDPNSPKNWSKTKRRGDFLLFFSFKKTKTFERR